MNRGEKWVENRGFENGTVTQSDSIHWPLYLDHLPPLKAGDIGPEEKELQSSSYM